MAYKIHKHQTQDGQVTYSVLLAPHVAEEIHGRYDLVFDSHEDHRNGHIMLTPVRKVRTMLTHTNHN